MKKEDIYLLYLVKLKEKKRKTKEEKLLLDSFNRDYKNIVKAQGLKMLRQLKTYLPKKYEKNIL